LLVHGVVRAGSIAAVSGRTASVLEEVIPGTRGRITVIPWGMRHGLRGAAVRTHLLAFGGATDPRKRVDFTIDVYQAYCRRHRDALPLVVLARAGLTSAQHARLARLGAQVIADGDQTTADQLLAGAATLIYPTRQEGFGFPIVEAAEFQTPVMVASDADLPEEVIGPHVYRLPADRPEEWAEAIDQLVATGPARKVLRLDDWPLVAAKYETLYRLVAATYSRATAEYQ
jgi:glycosyltransferase involved in cell wall biosynthesis